MASDTRSEERFGIAGSFRAWLGVYLKGLAMGSADSVPGVSGGTIAFIVGIYERLITAIASLDPRVVAHVRHVHRADGRKALWADLTEMDVPFLVVLGSGAVSALLLVSRAAHVALDRYEALTFAFFFGLIAASVVVFYDQFTLDSPGRIAAAVAGFGFAFLISGVSESAIPNALPVVFLSAAVAISATILPGVSGAFLLLLFGQYNYLSTQLTNFVDALIAFALGDGTITAAVDPGSVVVVFAVGAVLGLLSVARLIRRALDSYRLATLAFLVSLMLGALRLPIEKILENTSSPGPVEIGSLVGLALVGGVAVLALERYTGSLDY